MSIKDELADQLLEAAIDDIKTHAKSGVLNPGDLFEKLGENDGVSSTVTYTGASNPKDEEYVTVYSTKDGMPSDILVNMLSKTLKKRWQMGDSSIDPGLWGQRAFSLRPVMDYNATVEPLLCIFHKDSEERAFLNSHGLSTRVCRKSNLPTEWDRLMHARHRHKSEMLAFMEAKNTESSKEYNEQQKLQTEGMSAMVKALQEVLSSKDTAKE